MAKDTFFCPKKTLNFRGNIKELSTPWVMGILNVTPDSFHDGGRYANPDQAIIRIGQMLEEGADCIDIGAASTKPGSKLIDPGLEQERLMPVLKNAVKAYPETIFSIDTYHASTAEMAADQGASMINDISGGQFDPDMFRVIARLRIPYCMMHIQGTPETMQVSPAYSDPIREVMQYFAERIDQLRQMGATDLIIDPGFGFGKTVEHNYELLAGLSFFKILGLPILAGVSRKSMINRVLNIKADQALNGTTAVHALALMEGADILRVHDVKEAVETVKIFAQFASHLQNGDAKIQTA